MVESTSLLTRRPFTGTEGSNPSPSAKDKDEKSRMLDTCGLLIWFERTMNDSASEVFHTPLAPNDRSHSVFIAFRRIVTQHWQMLQPANC